MLLRIHLDICCITRLLNIYQIFRMIQLKEPGDAAESVSDTEEGDTEEVQLVLVAEL